MINILIAEDEDDIRSLLSLHLKKEGYNIFEASDGLEALNIFKKEEIDLAILDIMMPKLDGYKLLSTVRTFSEVPVIFLTARGEDHDKVLGLELGADDYVVKPFSVLEIRSRVQANLRRYLNYAPKEKKNILSNGSIKMDLSNYKVTKNDVPLNLNPKEFKMLSIFMKNIGQVYTKKQLYELVWEDIYQGDKNTIMVHISHLRDKIEDNSKSPKYIKTVHGIGYCMEKVNEE